MNQSEMMNPWGLISLKPISLFFIMSSSTSSSSDPLFSFVAALYALILLYFPGGALCFSPAVILLTAIALLCILRLGALQETTEPTTTTAGSTITEAHKPNDGAVKSDSLTRPDPDCFSSFVQWDVGAPLEVIYEEGEDHFPPQFDLEDRIEGTGDGIMRRCPSLSMYYPESDDSDSSDDGGEFCGGGFRWEEEDREGMLIEIDLDHRKNKGFDRLGFCGEEENMIEIDISPGKLDDVFSGEVCYY